MEPMRGHAGRPSTSHSRRYENLKTHSTTNPTTARIATMFIARAGTCASIFSHQG